MMQWNDSIILNRQKSLCNKGWGIEKARWFRIKTIVLICGVYDKLIQCSGLILCNIWCYGIFSSPFGDESYFAFVKEVHAKVLEGQELLQKMLRLYRYLFSCATDQFLVMRMVAVLSAPFSSMLTISMV